MKVYFVESIFGIFIISESGELIEYIKLDKYDVIKILTEGYNSSYAQTIYELLYKLKQKYNDVTVIFEDERAISEIRKIENQLPFEYHVEKPSFGGTLFRRDVFKYLLSAGISLSETDLQSYIHGIATMFSEFKVKRLSERRDLLIVQTISAIDDLNKIINLIASRLREWYGYHFPELNDLVENHKTFLRIVYEIGTRNNMKKEKLVDLGIPEKRAETIEEVASKSIGADFSDTDIAEMRKFAAEGLHLFYLKEELESYLTDLMEDMAPNLTRLAGALIGARLIKLAGGLLELARLPSSTIQVLGAEKALFLALRKKGKPPKHGVIFQHSLVHSAPRWLRGKIARVFAGKLSIAARVDAYSGHYIGDELSRDLERRVKELYKKYPKPPKKKLVEKEAKKTKREKKGKKKRSKKKRKR
ncbi:MAG: C/D box methylation guide ribonucleoprotein complex aNOP56 subunit [Candidatus Asgardarchaeia archaeon]